MMITAATAASRSNQESEVRKTYGGLVQIDGVSVSFGSAAHLMALQPTTLTLEAGSFTSIVGSSGCGKTTLMNTVGGFVKATRGQILIDGELVKGPTPKVGIVFQQYALFPWFSARKNVEFALKRFGLSKAERQERAIECLNEVGLAKRADSYPGQLSGGMKQRVAIARTLAANPDVLLMDEPFGALDAQTRMAMHELLLGIWKKRRMTVLFITHDIDEALNLSDRVHVMAGSPGRVIKTLDIDTPRPRLASAVDEEYMQNRKLMIELLRHAEE